MLGKLLGFIVLPLGFALMYGAMGIAAVLAAPIATARWILNPTRKWKEYFQETWIALLNLVWEDFGR